MLNLNQHNYKLHNVTGTNHHNKLNTLFRLLNVPLAFINNHMIKLHHMTETKLLLVQSTTILIYCLHSFGNKKDISCIQ